MTSKLKLSRETLKVLEPEAPIIGGDTLITSPVRLTPTILACTLALCRTWRASDCFTCQSGSPLCKNNKITSGC